MPHKLKRPSAALLCFLLAAAGPLTAQAGSTTDIITGTVTAQDGRPLVEAVVEVTSLETEVTRRARTDGRGRYTVLFPDGGGQYRVMVRAIGYAPQQFSVTRQADEDRFVANLRMSQVATQLAEITVQGRRVPVGLPEGAGPGGTERILNLDQLLRLPLDPSDLNLLAALAPGVTGVEGTDSTAAGFSVAGQRPDANAIALDGLLFGTATVPSEALRNVRVVTSTYDVSRGQFSGGLVASTTRGGTNLIQGSLTYGLRDQDLELTGADEEFASFGRGYTQHQLSGGLGGPVVRDRLFVFGSGRAQLRQDGLAALTSATPATLDRLGVAPDSVTRFLSLVSAAGVPVGGFRQDQDRDTDDLSFLLRSDWIVSDAHSLALRADARSNRQEPARIGALALPETGARNRSRGGGLMATLTSRFGTRVINEARAYFSTSARETDAAITLPQGRVQLAGVLADGRQAVSTLVFGGNPSSPQESSDRGVEATNELSWMSPNGGHRMKLGLLFSERATEQEFTSNQFGTFTYYSLADLEANRPAMYTRTLSPRRTEGSSTSAAAYVSDNWRPAAGLQLTYGLRLEHGRLSGAPGYNPDVEARFGVRTDRFPSETALTPRVGFSWIVGGGGPGLPAAVLRGGLGLFRSPLPAGLGGLARSADGLVNSEGQLVCIGDAVPPPDWTAFLADPASIPTSCLAGGPPLPFSQRAPNVTAFADGFDAPRSWRASLGIQRRISPLANLNAELTWARGVRQTGSRDLNLVPASSFTVAGEGGRPVYASPLGIDSATGAVSSLASRRDPAFGQVLVVDSDLRSTSLQLSLSANGIVTGTGTVYNLSYTLARVRDQSSGGTSLGAATTAGDPNIRDFTRSDLERRHGFTATVTHPFGQALELTAVARMISGTPYTPRVAGDINGDGARNDRAFVFDPAAAADTALANGMRRLLDNASGGTRGCLERQLGRIAGRNSCTGPWTPSLELQLNWRPNVLGLSRRLALSLTTVNLLAGVDEVLHGVAGRKGWGQTVRPDPTLLQVRGFDPQEQRFLYTVNERFGATNAGANAFRAPFQVGLQLRYQIGRDRFREAIQGLRGAAGGRAGLPGGPGGGGGGGGGRAGGGPGAGLATRVGGMANPPRVLLGLADSLRLSPEQRVILTREADSLDARLKGLTEAIQKEMRSGGANPDPAALLSRLRPRVEEGRKHVEAALEAARAALTAEQWAKVPVEIRELPDRLRAMGGAQRGDRRPPG